MPPLPPAVLAGRELRGCAAPGDWSHRRGCQGSREVGHRFRPQSRSGSPHRRRRRRVNRPRSQLAPRAGRLLVLLTVAPAKRLSEAALKRSHARSAGACWVALSEVGSVRAHEKACVACFGARPSDSRFSLVVSALVKVRISPKMRGRRVRVFLGRACHLGPPPPAAFQTCQRGAQAWRPQKGLVGLLPM